MKIENVTIKRKQIVFNDREFRDINNALCWLNSAFNFCPTDTSLQVARSGLSDVVSNIDIGDDDQNIYILTEETNKDDA